MSKLVWELRYAQKFTLIYKDIKSKLLYIIFFTGGVGCKGGKCNCDGITASTNDAGVLLNKDLLPISRIKLGPSTGHRTLKIGPLKCYSKFYPTTKNKKQKNKTSKKQQKNKTKTKQKPKTNKQTKKQNKNNKQKKNKNKYKHISY